MSSRQPISFPIFFGHPLLWYTTFSALFQIIFPAFHFGGYTISPQSCNISLGDHACQCKPYPVPFGPCCITRNSQYMPSGLHRDRGANHLSLPQTVSSNIHGSWGSPIKYERNCLPLHNPSHNIQLYYNLCDVALFVGHKTYAVFAVE